MLSQHKFFLQVANSMVLSVAYWIKHGWLEPRIHYDKAIMNVIEKEMHKYKENQTTLDGMCQAVEQKVCAELNVLQQHQQEDDASTADGAPGATTPNGDSSRSS